MKLLTTSEVGKILRCCPSTVRSLCDQRKLKVIRHSPRGRRLIVEESVYTFLESIVENPVESFEVPVVRFDPVDDELTARIHRLKRAK